MGKQGGVGMVEQLRRAIRASGRSLNQLGKESGVASSQLSHFMRGTRTLTLPAAERICRALGIGLTDPAPQGGTDPGLQPAPPRKKSGADRGSKI